MSAILPEQSAPGYSIRVLDNGEEIFSRRLAGEGINTQWAQKAAAEPYGIEWQVVAWPSAALVASMRSRLPAVLPSSCPFLPNIVRPAAAPCTAPSNRSTSPLLCCTSTRLFPSWLTEATDRARRLLTSDNCRFTLASVIKTDEMPMKNPPHPGRVVRQECLEPLGLTVTGGARALGVTRQALNNLVNGKSGISPEMAFRLSKAFGSTPELWLRLQMNYDLAQIRKHEDDIPVQRYRAKEVRQ